MKYIAWLIVLFAATSAFGESSITLVPVKPEQLYNLIADSDSMIIKTSPLDDAKILFKSTSPNDLKSFSESLQLTKTNPNEWFHCMCIGSPAIYFYKNGKETIHLTNHHGKSIRCQLWSSDVKIADIEKWVNWFDNHGITSVREEVEYSKLQAIKNQKDQEKWAKAMPTPLKSLLENAFGDLGIVDNKDIALLDTAIEKGIPDKTNRILSLLEWYGSGAGPWSGYPAYEDAAENLLLKYTTKEIVAALQSAHLTSSQIEGGARLFGGWDFNKQRPNDINQVSQEMKILFWNHVKSTKDEDKLERAKRAFTK